jgi:hypothetical protein
MGLTGFSLCDPKALSSVLRYNTRASGIISQATGEKEWAAEIPHFYLQEIKWRN